MEFSFSPKLLVVAVAAALPLIASAADTPSTATARKGFAGYDHPNQYLVKPATTIADNMMPVMQHPAQDKETQQKLAELEKKTGKKPNVVVFLLDDVGWMDVGFDDFRGFNSVSDMYTEWRDVHVNPEVALSPDRSEYIQKLPFSKDDVHAVRGGEQEAIADITPKYMEDLDQRWMEYGVKFLDKMAKSDKPFFLYYGTRGCHFDNYRTPNMRVALRRAPLTATAWWR